MSTSTSEAQLSYAFPSGRDQLTTTERARVSGFLNGFGLTGQDVLIVSVPAGGRPGSDNHRLRAVTQLLSGWPARTRFVLGSEDHVPAQIGVIRVVRVTAVSADCGDGVWAAGCASGRNLAAQIGSPVDALMPERRNRYLPPTGAIGPGPGNPESGSSPLGPG